MKLTMLGTGSAGVTECYNTCFAIENEGEYLLVDGGGGNLLGRLRAAGIRWQDIRHVFVTHVHTDHILGIFWLMRAVHYSKPGDLDGKTITFYGHDNVIALLRSTTMGLFPREDGGLHPAIRLVEVEDGQEFQAVGHSFCAFDVGSNKTKQFGFTMYYGDGKKLTCCGDEPYHECEREYAQGSTWLLHEAFCLASEADRFHPYEKFHSTAKDACSLAAELGVENLLLYHTEEKNLARRRELYTAEGKQYFSGNLVVPDDYDVLTIE